MFSDQRMSEEDMRAYERETLLAEAEAADPLSFPYMDSISPAFFYRFLPLPPPAKEGPEYVYVDDRDEVIAKRRGEDRSRYMVFVTQWNNVWEAGTNRRHMFDEEDVPPELKWVLDQEADIRLVPRGRKHRYDAYAPLYHLLPRSVLERFGLPLLRRGIWPHYKQFGRRSWLLPRDFDERLERAFSYHLWPLLGARGAPSAFSDKDPIRLLSHNLDYWMPHADMVAQEINRAKGRVKVEDEDQEAALAEARQNAPDGVRVERPLFGGTLWQGEDEAWELTQKIVEKADESGRLRGILDAVRSNRVEDDFSDRWSFEREDFERRLYRKRVRTKVRFVELSDTVPVHGPDSESDVLSNLLWEDFLAVMDEKERQIVICLRSGHTRVGEIAAKLGYASHAPISRRLKVIRMKVERLLGTP